MDNKSAIRHLDKVHKLRDMIERDLFVLQKHIATLQDKALAHNGDIISGVLAGTRRYLLKHEERLVKQLTTLEVKNDKEILNKRYGKVDRGS